MSIQLLSTENRIRISSQPLSIELTEFQACDEKKYRECLATKSVSYSHSFLQSDFWGQFKRTKGWTPNFFWGKVRLAESSHEYEFAFLSLSRSLLPKTLPTLFSLTYIPFGPLFFKSIKPQEIQQESQEEIQEEQPNTEQVFTRSWNIFVDSHCYFKICRLIGKKLLGYIPLSCFFVRIDSNYLLYYKQNCLEKTAPIQAQIINQTNNEISHTKLLRELGFYQAAQRVQVPDTIMLALRPHKDKLLAQMHKKHRYNIRLAQKKGVRVQLANWQEHLEEWYRIYQTTAKRDKINIHGFAYYQDLFKQSEKSNIHLALYLAYGPKSQNGSEISLHSSRGNRQEALAGIIVLHHKSTATYLYGASSNEDRELMPNYLLQWQAICQAQAAGMQYYDFFGIPAQANPQDPLYGLYRFKIGFGGSLLRRAGAIDLPYSKILYHIYRIVELGRHLLYRIRHHQTNKSK